MNRSILIIDDDKISSFLVQRQLKGVGLDENIVTRDGGISALKYLELCGEDEMPSFIFLDIQMPVMNGFEFLEELKDRRIELKETKIIAISSFLRPTEVELLEKAGVYKVIVKPVNLFKLKDVLCFSNL